MFVLHLRVLMGLAGVGLIGFECLLVYCVVADYVAAVFGVLLCCGGA